ncbi:hypothetical protein ALC62_07497 [Cyphomyrmex costatus]|uniref:Uncharacterized protein n=1 Tax=Cyphomyrmex costatus TaxID=456900 RepID=A0A151IHM8_9HYME|nr:hypothetical protein ALC62_07497 [Cyphomyrmex costatus]
MTYGAEIWGWKERESLERVMMNYVRWIFGLDFCTPRYVIMRELTLTKLKVAKEVEGGIGYNIEKELIEREKDVQRQWEDAKIRNARYNKKYKEIEAKGKGPRYLEKVNLQELQRGDEIMALVKLRCGNLEEANKFWKREKEDREMMCVFCGDGKDDLEYYVKFCEKVRGWFQELGENSDEIIKIFRDENLDETKGKIISRLWKENEKEKENANKKRGVD